MIKNSFIFLERINHNLEQHIWGQNILDWDSFLNTSSIKGISNSRKKYYDRRITEARSAVYRSDSSFFNNILPSSEAYRLYDSFKDDTVFLDIETTGLSPQYSDITMVGLYDGFDTKIMIKDINLDPQALKQELSKYKLIVTFNGATFDIPFINKIFPDVLPNIPNLDLRVATRRLGLTGGLKRIEKVLNIRRRQIVGDLTGGDALTLWKMYKSTGDDHYLNLLIEYNEEDIINLKTIAEHTTRELKNRLFSSKCLVL